MFWKLCFVMCSRTKVVIIDLKSQLAKTILDTPAFVDSINIQFLTKKKKTCRLNINLVSSNIYGKKQNKTDINQNGVFFSFCRHGIASFI